MWESFEDVENDIGRLNQVPPLPISRPTRIKNVINKAQLRRAETELLAGGDNMTFLRKARHTFGTRNKKYFELLEAAIDYDEQLGGDIEDEEDQPPEPVPDGGAAAAEPEPQVALIDDQLLCTLCYDRQKSHVIMPCCHRICERCAERVQENAGQDATCPFCRGVVWRIGILRD